MVDLFSLFIGLFHWSRTSPCFEAPYPVALEDSYAALLWMKTHTKELGIREDQIIAGGESAGGGLTTALTLYARDTADVNIAFQIPLYPMMDDRMITEFVRENNAPIWNSNTNSKYSNLKEIGHLYIVDDQSLFSLFIGLFHWSRTYPLLTFWKVLV